MATIKKAFTKSQLYSAISEDTGLTKKQVASVFDSLKEHMHGHLRPGAAAVFTIPGLAKVTSTTKPATPEREGINPFTGEPTVFKAKPARRVVKVRPLKGLKELAE